MKYVCIQNKIVDKISTKYKPLVVSCMQIKLFSRLQMIISELTFNVVYSKSLLQYLHIK